MAEAFFLVAATFFLTIFFLGVFSTFLGPLPSSKIFISELPIVISSTKEIKDKKSGWWQK